MGGPKIILSCDEADLYDDKCLDVPKVVADVVVTNDGDVVNPMVCVGIIIAIMVVNMMTTNMTRVEGANTCFMMAFELL